MKQNFFKTASDAPTRGFTLLIAVIFTTVILSIGLALADVAFKQVALSSTARQSEYAFYAADAALECALFEDQRLDTFDYASEPTSGSFSCEGQAVSFTASIHGTLPSRTTTFSIPCAGGGTQADVVLTKTPTNSAKIDTSGYNTCNTADPNRVERGLKATY